MAPSPSLLKTAAAGLAIITLGCSSAPVQPKATLSLQEALNQLADPANLCDTDGFSMAAAVVTRAATVRAGRVPLVSARNLVNSQVHDCQALIARRNGDLRLGPRVALLVSVDAIEKGDFGQGVVVADVHNYGVPDGAGGWTDTPYDSLGIPPGRSCLWIRSGVNTASGWVAAFRPPTNNDCSTTQFDNNPSRPLEVNRLTVSVGQAIYPSTGRWMWDHTRDEQFVATRCAHGWCEIGRRGFTGTSSISTWDRVPGWYDEQLLAYDAGNGLVVSGLFGRIEPGNDNATVERQGVSGGPYHVATMRFFGRDDAAYQAYADRFELEGGAMSKPHPVDFQVKRPWLPPWRRIMSIRSRMSSWNSIQRHDATHSGSGTVRWAWSEDDEGFWVPCDAGCCKATDLK